MIDTLNCKNAVSVDLHFTKNNEPAKGFRKFDKAHPKMSRFFHREIFKKRITKSGKYLIYIDGGGNYAYIRVDDDTDYMLWPN